MSTVIGFSVFILLAFALFVLVMMVFMKAYGAIRQDLLGVSEKISKHLEESISISHHASERTSKAMNEVCTTLGRLEESSRQIREVGKEVAKLQDVLKAPKARGGFGELLLEDLLREMIPRDHFGLQHQFRSGARVDAVIFVGAHLVPIDAKFPLENFERLVQVSDDAEKIKARREFARDIKRHIDAIAERYICPTEGTFDFAMMYVPAENVYYEMLCSGSESMGGESLSRYSLAHHVIPVSPNSFYAYLEVILLGLRGLKIDEAAREIAESLVNMRSGFSKILDEFSTLGTHLNHAQNAHERTQRKLDQFEGQLVSIDHVRALTHSEVKPLEGVNVK